MPSLYLLDKLNIDRRKDLPLHAQLQQAMRKMIREDFKDGDAFFTETDITNRFGVSRGTVRQAMGELTREGFLLRRKSTGTIVLKRSAQVRTSDAKPPEAANRVLENTIGVFVDEYNSEFLALLLQSIMEESRRRSFSVHTYYTHRGEDLRHAYQQIMHGPQNQRFILITVSRELEETLAAGGYRTISFERPFQEYAGDVVETDARMAVQVGVDYLRFLGHEQITFLVNEPAILLSVQDKIEHFRRILPGGRIVLCETQVWQDSHAAAYGHMEEVWDGGGSGNRPTAIMTASDTGAWAAMRWLQEREISVPGVVSVLGFENARSSRFTHPSLSSIGHNYAALTQKALDILWEDGGVTRHERLAPELVIRESTGPRL